LFPAIDARQLIEFADLTPATINHPSPRKISYFLTSALNQSNRANLSQVYAMLCTCKKSPRPKCINKAQGWQERGVGLFSHALLANLLQQPATSNLQQQQAAKRTGMKWK